MRSQGHRAVTSNGATENAEVENAVKNARVEKAGVENAGADSKGGKCRSRQAVWKAEPILYLHERPVSYFLKLSSDF